MKLEEIYREIDRLEHDDTNYQNCTKLAVLYCIADHNKPQRQAQSFGSSEFLLAVSRASLDDVLLILDEHMEAIKLLYPKEYAQIIRRIKEKSS